MPEQPTITEEKCKEQMLEVGKRVESNMTEYALVAGALGVLLGLAIGSSGAMKAKIPGKRSR